MENGLYARDRWQDLRLGGYGGGINGGISSGGGGGGGVGEEERLESLQGQPNYTLCGLNTWIECNYSLFHEMLMLIKCLLCLKIQWRKDNRWPALDSVRLRKIWEGLGLSVAALRSAVQTMRDEKPKPDILGDLSVTRRATLWLAECLAIHYMEMLKLWRLWCETDLKCRSGYLQACWPWAITIPP